MPGIVKGDSSSCAKPLLPFFYQESGLLKDVYSLRFSVFRIGSTTSLLDVTSNLDDCDSGGDKKDTGYYVAPLDTQALSLDTGSYEIVWYYKPVSTSTELTVSYFFEVLDPKYFRVSSAYEGYVASNNDSLEPWDLYKRQQAILNASREIEKITGRIFFPRYMTIKHSVRPKSTQVWLDQPIIAIQSVVLETANYVSGVVDQFDLDLGTLKVFNRHLSFLLSPDDRDDPKLAFAYTEDNDFSPVIFPRGVQDVLITGVFGYTDPDGGPFGVVPSQISEATIYLAYRSLSDPLGADPFLQYPGRVRSAKTRDQSISFDTSYSAGATSETGDERIDRMLLKYHRPPHVGVAG